MLTIFLDDQIDRVSAMIFLKCIYNYLPAIMNLA